MNASRIILPDFLIADLYKSCLVETDTSNVDQKELFDNSLPPLDKIPVLSDKIKYTGENLKNITLIVNQPDTIDLNNNDLTFLINILKACKLNLADMSIINAAHQNINYNEIKEQLCPLQIILFDVEPSSIKLPFLIPPFQIQVYAETTIMLAPSLSVLNTPDKQGKLLKTKLWNSLRQIFGIN